MADLSLHRAESSELKAPSHGNLFEKTWRLPGAFKETCLNHANPAAQERVTEDDVRTAVELKRALKLPYEKAFVSVEPAYRDALLFLSLADPSGASVKRVEETIRQLHEQALAVMGSEGIIPKALTALKALPEASESLSARVPVVTEEARVLDIVKGSSSSDSLSPLGSQAQMIEQTLIEAMSGAFAIAVAEEALSGQKNQRTGEVRSVLETAGQWVNEKLRKVRTESIGQREKLGIDEETAITVLCGQSTSAKIHEFDRAMTALSSELEAASKTMGKASQGRYFIKPIVVLYSSPRSLIPDEEDKEKEQEQVTRACPADESSLMENRFLVLGRDGIYCSDLRYDNQWGKLVTNRDQNPVQFLFSAAIKGVFEGKTYDAYMLAQAVTLFPVLGETMRKSIVQALSGKDFEHYLSASDRWLGERIRRVKPWLKEGDASEQECAELCAKIHGALKDGGGRKTDLEGLTIFCSSLLLNTEGEGLLYQFVRDSLSQGVPLKDVVVKGKNLLESHVYATGNPNFLKLFEKTEDGVRLTSFGCEYILDLTNNENPYYETGDDNIDYQEGRAREQAHRMW